MFLAYVGATLGHMGGPSWAKRVAFLDTAPGLVVNLRSVGEWFCRHCAVFGCSWLPLGLHGATWAGRGEPRGSVGDPFCRHCAVFGCSWLTLGLHGAAWAGRRGPRGLHF